MSFIHLTLIASNKGILVKKKIKKDHCLKFKKTQIFIIKNLH